MREAPTLLARTAQANEDDSRARLDDSADICFVLSHRQRAEWRRAVTDDIESYHSGLKLADQALEHFRTAAVQIDAQTCGGRGFAQSEHQRWTVDSISQAGTM